MRTITEAEAAAGLTDLFADKKVKPKVADAKVTATVDEIFGVCGPDAVAQTRKFCEKAKPCCGNCHDRRWCAVGIRFAGLSIGWGLLCDSWEADE